MITTMKAKSVTNKYPFQYIEPINSSYKFVTIKASRSHGRCNECRRRKKKCDESKPSCSACIKREIPCVYTEYRSRKSTKQRSNEVRQSTPNSNRTPVSPSTCGIFDSNQCYPQSPNLLIDYGPIEGSERTFNGSSNLNKLLNDMDNEMVAVANFEVNKVGNIYEKDCRPGDDLEIKSTHEPVDYSVTIPQIEMDTGSKVLEVQTTDLVKTPPCFENQEGSVTFGVGIGKSNNNFQIENFNDTFFSSLLFGMQTPGNIFDSPPYLNSMFNTSFDFQEIKNKVIVSHLSPQEMFSSYDTSDLDNAARSLLNNFKYFVSSSEKYNHCMKLFLPVSHKDKAVMYALCGWGGMLTTNENRMRSQEYIKKSITVCDKNISRLSSGPKVDCENLLYIVVCLSCHILIGTSTGDIKEWKKSFEKLRLIFKKVGLANFVDLVSDKKVALWVLNCFFYHDVLKVTTSGKLGTVFPLSEYKKVLSLSFEDLDEPGQERSDFDIRCKPMESRCFTKDNIPDPFMGSCVGLYILLGEINNLYDEVIVKQDRLFSMSAKLAVGKAATDEEKFRIISSDEFSAYEDARIDFHDYVERESAKLIKRIGSTVPSLSVADPRETELQLTHFEVMQLTIGLFLRVKIKEMSSLDFEVKRLLLYLYRGMKALLYTKFTSYLAFTLLVAGAAAADDKDRITLKLIYSQIISYSKEANICRAWDIVQEFWKENPDGARYYNWQIIVNKLDWNICMG